MVNAVCLAASGLRVCCSEVCSGTLPILIWMAVATWGAGIGLGFLVVLLMQDDEGSWWALVPGAVMLLAVYGVPRLVAG